MIDEAITVWIEGQRSNLGFIRFFAMLQEQADNKTSEALQSGDTEFTKGELIVFRDGAIVYSSSRI